jgi:FAD/FMN-containing dehydrogenase
VLGGGFGLLARSMGLSCDSLASVELVDADGKIRNVDAASDADLFWALRGGGGGTFGAVTQFEFKTHAVGETVVFGLSWLVPAPQATAIMTAWQSWAPHAPREITSFFRLSKGPGNLVRLRCAGQSLGSETALRHELQMLIDVAKPSATTIESLSFFGAVNHFSGGWDYESDYSKGKSSYVDAPLGADALDALFEAMAQDTGATPVLVCDAYGGAIPDVAADATAFAHRSSLCCIQYHATWGDAASSARQIEQIDRVYVALQPYVSGGAYVNYCDLELASWGEAYWGSNLPRLKKIKSSFDPANVFTHAQSV